MLAPSAYVPWLASGEYDDETNRPHPTLVCEPINLAATEQPPITYRCRHSAKGLSTMQTETICRIMQSFRKRGAFLLGDATGVGKGRTIAGLISEISASQPSDASRPSRVVWVSASIRLYADAISEYEATRDAGDAPFSEMVLFASYTGMNPTRQDDIFKWLKDSSFPVLILDECHALRNPKGLNSQAVDLLIRNLSSEVNINILYSSATACSIPRHMSYLGRLGLFASEESPFLNFESLSQTLRTHGPSLMELIAIDMRSRGAYVARQLSFADICVTHRVMTMNSMERRCYDACGEALRQADLFSGSTHQSFFQRLITGLKVREAICIIEEELTRGSSVVVSLVNTGEAAMKRQENVKVGQYGTIQYIGEDMLMRADASHIDSLPQNPIDALIDHFGVDRVAELTGRQIRYVVQRDGRRVCEKNPKLRTQVEDFQSGRKHIAVLSRAGGVGISLHDANDGRPRTHLILEMPWSAEDLLQQMGRTHRSNSQSPPSYILLTTDVPAEQRFASSIVNKLRSFGALVKADRSSCTFSFLKVPRWSVAERRSIALFLATARALPPDEKCLLPTLSRAQALAACQCEQQNSEVAVKSRLIDMLLNVEELGDRRLTIVSAAQTLYPRDVTMLMHRWTTDTHVHFPTAFKRQVVALLLCAQAWETQCTLGRLSKDMVFMIIEHMACPVTLEDARVASLRFKQHNVRDLSSLQVDMILNRMLGMEMNVQQSIFAIADALVQPETPPPTACLIKFVNDRSGSAVLSSIASIDHCSLGRDVHGVCVCMKYTVRQPEHPADGAKFWRHAQSGRTCWIDTAASTMIFSDCCKVKVMSYDAQVLRMRDYFPCRHDEWIHQVYRHEQNAARRIGKLPTRFYIATSNALRMWDQSMHRVLRVHPMESFPHGIVGLLIKIA